MRGHRSVVGPQGLVSPFTTNYLNIYSFYIYGKSNDIKEFIKCTFQTGVYFIVDEVQTGCGPLVDGGPTKHSIFITTKYPLLHFSVMFYTDWSLLYRGRSTNWLRSHGPMVGARGVGSAVATRCRDLQQKGTDWRLLSYG